MHWTIHTRYFLPTAETKNYNIKIDGKNYFDQPVGNDLKTYDNIWKIVTGEGDNYKAGCLWDCPHFKEHYKLIAMDLSKQHVLSTDPKAIQQIIFTRNLEQAGNTIVFFFHYWRSKTNYFAVSQGTVKVL